MKSRLALRPLLWRRSGSSAAGPGRRGQHHRCQAADHPVRAGRATTLPRRHRSPSGAPRPGARSSRPARAASSVLENFGNKFPGEAAVYMGIVHVAIYDAAVAIKGGYQPYAATPAAPAGHLPRGGDRDRGATTRSPVCQPQLGASQAILDADYAAYLAAIPDGTAKTDGIAVGQQAAAGSARAARERRPWVHHDGRGPRPARARARRLATRARAGARPLPARDAAARARRAPSQFRPDGPNALDQPGVRRRLQPGRGPGPSRQHDQDDRRRPTRPCSGPTTTSGSGTTACSASPPPAGSISCRPPGCWRWRTSPAATR